MAVGARRNAPEISLVVGTVGRSLDLSRLLDSLKHQPTDRLELIIVDQNTDERVSDLLAARSDPFPVRYVRVPWRGISRARNFGASLAAAPVLAFPDDDCHYPVGLIEGVLEWFASHPEADGLSCRVTDVRGRASAGGFMSRHSHWIRRGNVWRSAVAPGIFVRRRLHAAVQGFDERLGAGAETPWGSAEDSDYLLRAIEEDSRIFYAADRVVLHPRTIGRAPRLARGWSYGRGMGFTLRKHGFGIHTATYFASISGLAAAWSCLRLDPGPALTRAAMGAGRVAGWIQSRRALMVWQSGPAPLRPEALRTTTP